MNITYPYRVLYQGNETEYCCKYTEDNKTYLLFLTEGWLYIVPIDVFIERHIRDYVILGKVPPKEVFRFKQVIEDYPFDSILGLNKFKHQSVNHTINIK